MRIRVVCKVLSLIGLVISLCMVFPLLWSLADQSEDTVPFLHAMLAGLAVSGGLYWLGRNDRVGLGPREAFAVVTFSWVIASGIGALPFWFHGTVGSYTDGFFEAMSGFTTTGASVLPDIEANPRGILFWRSLTHWLGGMGIIVLSLAILPFLGIGGMQLYKAEVPGPIPEKLTPRVQKTALMLWGVYVLLSVAETIALLFAGCDLFESLTHTFGTMATGGFSPLNGSIGQYNSALIDWIVVVFMFLSGSNFALHYLALMGRFRYIKDPEFLVYLQVVVYATAGLALLLTATGAYAHILDSLRFAAFQVVSILTTTGYVTADYELWPFVSQMLLLVFMFVGGCGGSTGGGMKHIRIIVLLKQVRVEMLRLLHPRGIFPVRVGGKVLEPGIVSAIMGFFIFYIALFALGSLVMAGLGLDLLTATGSVAATLGNIGPGVGGVGPMDNYAAVPQAGKWVLTFFMLAGRLEIFTVLMLFAPVTWRR